MKVHLHIGVVEGADEATVKEALAAAALQHEVLTWLAPNVAVMERENARRLAESLRELGMHPRVVE